MGLSPLLLPASLLALLLDRVFASVSFSTKGSQSRSRQNGTGDKQDSRGIESAEVDADTFPERGKMANFQEKALGFS